jgi:hypothetical protein
MNRLAYLFDPEELDLLEGWPDGVGLALCLSLEGSVQAVLYEPAAEGRILWRLSEATGWKPGTFSVAPAVDGAKTFRVTFSEAQSFFRIVSGIDGLLDLALDYQSRCGAPIRPQAPPAAPPTRPAEEAPQAAAPAVPKEWGDVAPVPEPPPPTGAATRPLPAGFRTVEDLALQPPAVLSGNVRTTGARVRVTVEPEHLPPGVLPVQARLVGHRDDLRCFVLDADCAEEWRAGSGLMIDAPMSAFPDALVSRFKRGICAAEVVMGPEGIYVTPAMPLAPTRAAAPTPAPRAAPPAATVRRRRPALVTVLALVLVSGTIVTALQMTASPAFGLFKASPLGGNAAFQALSARVAAEGEAGG